MGGRDAWAAAFERGDLNVAHDPTASTDPPQKKKRNKYSAIKTKVDGITFDSKREANRYADYWKPLWLAGEVRWVLLQVPFRLPGGTIYRLDFMALWADGRLTYEDVKGVQTKEFRIKKREVEHRYGITIDLA